MNLFLKQINLSNFRNYAGKNNSFQFHKPFVFIIGPNASGKSSLLEAIQTSSVSSESWADNEKQLVTLKSEEPFFGLEAIYDLEGRDHKLELRGGQSSFKNIKINGVEYRTASQAKDELMKVVSFRARESIEIVRGAPAQRREWLDITLKLLSPHYTDSLKRYTRSLEQRNSLLKLFVDRKRSKETVLQELELWDSELIKYGMSLMQQRQQFLQETKAAFANNYNQIASEKVSEIAEINYLPNVGEIEEAVFLAKLQERHELDLIRGQTSVGPHRDDYAFLLDDKEAKFYASQGQQRTCALALKLIQLQKWQEKLGFAPILLLDDVAAELDLQRQEALFSSLPADGQIFITTTHLVNLPNRSASDYQIVNLNKTN
jgi:DNA replication and repair protein RecF